MKTVLITCSTTGLELEPFTGEHIFEELILFNKGIFIEDFKEDKFQRLIGLCELNSLLQNPFFVNSFAFDEDVDLYKRLYYYRKNLECFFLFLWFIKDNSANVIRLFGYHRNNLAFENETNPPVSISSHLYFSSSTGDYKKETFTIEELNETKKIYDFFIDNIVTSEASPKEMLDDTKKSGEITTSDFNKLIFKTQNCIERAVNFLVLARGSSFLPIKILYYMSILESLFAIDNIDISKKISKRTSKYIGGNKEKRKRISFYITQAYDVRSRMVHGDSLHNDSRQSQNDLIKLSNEIDVIIRELLLKVIMVDFKLFLVDQDEFGEWLTQFD